MLIGIITRASSAILVIELKIAQRLDSKDKAISGKDGGEFNNLCDVNIVVPAEDTPRIQEMHIVIGHTICHLIDQAFNKA